MKVKPVKNWRAGRAMAAPMAAPRKGAEQGVATTVARMPEKKEPVWPLLLWSFPPTEVAEVPSSKMPNMFKARMNMRSRRMMTTHGFWSW